MDLKHIEIALAFLLMLAPVAVPASPQPSAAAKKVPPVPPTSQSIEHPGPAGLPWDCDADQAKTLLSPRFELADEGDNNVHYQLWTGEFAGFKTEHIRLFFDKDDSKLLSLTVFLQLKDQRPASTRFLELLSLMVSKYGAPSQFNKPLPTQAAAYTDKNKSKKDDRPSSVLLKMDRAMEAQLEAQQFQELDQQILSGAWVPEALWKFKNGMNVWLQGNRPAADVLTAAGYIRSNRNVRFTAFASNEAGSK